MFSKFKTEKQCENDKNWAVQGGRETKAKEGSLIILALRGGGIKSKTDGIWKKV